jgi:hypothetical protein
MNQSEDPGWPRTIEVLLMLVPGAQFWNLRRQRAGDPLVLLRATFLSFSISLIAFGIVLAAIGGLPNGPVVPWVPILIALVVTSIVGVHLVMRKPLTCDSEAALATSYRKRFFATIAMTEFVALFAFVFTFIGGLAWIYDAGGTFTLIRFWTTSAPTRSALMRDQDALNDHGCGLSLIAAIRSNPPPPRGWRSRPD